LLCTVCGDQWSIFDLGSFLDCQAAILDFVLPLQGLEPAEADRDWKTGNLVTVLLVTPETPSHPFWFVISDAYSTVKTRPRTNVFQVLLGVDVNVERCLVDDADAAIWALDTLGFLKRPVEL
jgi:hypothetical protein